MRKISIVNYRAEHQPYFEAFNRAWIEKIFEMEPVDTWMVTNPGKAILEPGGAILMAEYNGVPAGTIGLRKLNETTYEIIKMAVSTDFRRLGIGEALCYSSFLKAKEMGATTVILYSNKLNAEAVKLYEKIGFTHAAVEPGIYKRANVKMTINIEKAETLALRYEVRMLRESLQAVDR